MRTRKCRGDPFQPGRDIHAVAENIVVVDDDIADMNPDPVFDSDILSHVGVLRGYAALDLHRATRRIDGAGELREYAVTRGLDDTAAMHSDGGIDERLSQRFQIGVRAFLIHAHQTAVTGHVRRQHRRQSPFHTLAQAQPLVRGKFECLHNRIVGRCLARCPFRAPTADVARAPSDVPSRAEADLLRAFQQVRLATRAPVPSLPEDFARSEATTQSIFLCAARWMLCGVCHRADIRPTRWLAMTKKAHTRGLTSPPVKPDPDIHHGETHKDQRHR